MYWRQKASLVCDTVTHRDTLHTQIYGFLDTKSLRYRSTLDGTTDTGKPATIMVVEYDLQADADQAWAFVMQAQTNNWIVNPAWARYASMNDDGSVNTLLGYLNW